MTMREVGEVKAAKAPLLGARDIHIFHGGRLILGGVNVELYPGEVVGLIGPNGAGKSSLLNVLAGDYPPAQGEVLVAGASYADLGDRGAAQIRSVMLQDTSVAFPFRVREVVQMGRSAWGDDVNDEARIDEALGLVGMSAYAEREITTLSGGERARAALARVIVQDAQVILLDEPTAAMDIGYSEKTMRIVRNQAAQGKGVLVVIHDLATAAKHCDRLVLLADQKVVAVGSPDEVCTSELLSEVYGWDIEVIEVAGERWIRPC